MRRLILGTAGHIDHGKTALVRALTGIDTDRLPEEKRRGITIDLGFANLLLEDGTEIGIVDVPGHEGFIRNMLAGATGIDVGLLVVAADEGVMPQTREHHAILSLLGVRGMVVALTKSDLADLEWRDLVTEDVRALLADGPFADSAVIAVSARTGEGFDRLRSALADAAGRVVLRADDDLFRLPIDRVFTVRGTGTVITGTVWSGAVARDALVRVLPADQILRIRAIQSHGSDRARAAAGQRAALALAGTPRTGLKRGDVLVAGDAWEPGRVATLRLRVLGDAAPVRTGQRVRFHIGTSEALGRIVPFRPGAVAPGEEAWVQIRLEQPIVARAGDRFVIRSYSPVTTVGGGQVVEPAAPRRRRPAADLAATLEAILTTEPTAAIRAVASLAGWTGTPVARLAVRTTHAPRVIDAALELPATGITRVGAIVWAEQVAQDARRRILDAVDAYHRDHALGAGATRDVLRAALPAPAALADLTVNHLVADGALEAEGVHVRAAGFVPRLDRDQDAAAARLLGFIQDAGLAAPGLQELPPDLASRPDLLDLVHYLVRDGALVALTGDRFAAPAAIDQAVHLLRARLTGRGPAGPGEFRDLLGVSRKYLIPLLEYLDRTGVTARNGDLRHLLQTPVPLQVEPDSPR